MSFYRRVKKVIDDCDVVLEVLDARFPELCRNKKLEEYAKRKGKQIILVLNKIDLTAREKIRGLKFNLPFVLVSAKKRTNLRKLRAAIGIAKSKLKIKRCKIGVIGYPNTGKSSIINALVGRKVAKTSIKAGFTKGEQWIRVSKDLLMDTPGVMPISREDEFLSVLTCSKNPEQLKDVELCAIKLIEFFKEESADALKKYFGFEVEGVDAEKILQKFAIRRNKLTKYGKPDIETVARIFLQDYYSGKLKI